MDAVNEYRSRREKRLADRGIFPEKSGLPDSINRIVKYAIRRDDRLKDRGHRMDAEGDEEKQNNGESSGGHGNTKLPFGLCKRFGIEIGKDWTPRDAWSALESKGITPSVEFEKRSGKKTSIERPTGSYKNVRVTKVGDTYTIRGDLQARGGIKEQKDVQVAGFRNKNEMFACLQEYGVNSAIDPDTGERVNPLTMDLPKTVAKKDEQRFTDLVLGTRTNKSGAPYDRRGFTLVAKDFDGKKVRIGVYDTPEKAKEYAEKYLKCKLEDLRETKDYKAWVAKGKSPDEEYSERYK